MKKLKTTFTILFAILVFSIIYYFTYNLAEPNVYDFMTRTFLTNKFSFDKNKQIYGNNDVVLAVIDNKTCERYPWPWAREDLCDIFNYFTEYAKPKVIVHDSILRNPDLKTPESDKKYFNTLSKIDNLIEGFIPFSIPQEDTKDSEHFDEIFIPKYKISIDNKNLNYIPQMYQSIMPMPKAYMNSVKNFGSVSMVPGSIYGDTLIYDNVFRNQEYIFNYDNYFFPSLAFKTFLIAHNNPKTVLSDKYIEFPELNYKVKYQKSLYQMFVPMRFYKLYPTGYSHPKYSVIDIIDSYNDIKLGKKPIIEPSVFKDKIVVLGANVTGGESLNDNKHTPMGVNHPGVDFQATAIDNIMHNDFLTVLPNWVNVLITILGMLLIYFIVKFSKSIKSIFGIFLLAFIYLVICCTCFYNLIVLNVITPLVMFTLITIIAYMNKFSIENKNKEKVKSVMGKYMSEDVMKDVIKNIDNLGLGGKKAEVTVLFADIRGFTSMSEKMTAQEVSELLNEYFSEMEPIITSHNGIINKFIGDAVMAIFGEPIQDVNHAQNAVICGIEMLEKVKELHTKWEKEGKPLIEIGVGINTGEVFVGNIGSVNRMEYTVIGDTVNLASRLESYNKQYKTKMLISSSTYNEISEIVETKLIQDVEIRGKAEKMNVYEVIKILN